MHKKSVHTPICEKCEFYKGGHPANVPNFKCGIGVKMFKVFMCPERDKRLNQD